MNTGTTVLLESLDEDSLSLILNSQGDNTPLSRTTTDNERKEEFKLNMTNVLSAFDCTKWNSRYNGMNGGWRLIG